MKKKPKTMAQLENKYFGKKGTKSSKKYHIDMKNQIIDEFVNQFKNQFRDSLIRFARGSYIQGHNDSYDASIRSAIPIILKYVAEKAETKKEKGRRYNLDIEVVDKESIIGLEEEIKTKLGV